MTLTEALMDVDMNTHITVIDTERKNSKRVVSIFEYIQPEYSDNHEVIETEKGILEIKFRVRSIKND